MDNKNRYWFFKAYSMQTVAHLAYFVTWIFAGFTFSNFLPVSSDNLSTQWSRTQLSILYRVPSPAWHFEVYVQSTACRCGPERPVIFHACTGLNLTASTATGAQPPTSHSLLRFWFIPRKSEMPWWGCVDRSFFLLLQPTKLAMQKVSLH